VTTDRPRRLGIPVVVQTIGEPLAQPEALVGLAEQQQAAVAGSRRRVGPNFDVEVRMK
jgi:hypothetical protein